MTLLPVLFFCKDAFVAFVQNKWDCKNSSQTQRPMSQPLDKDKEK